MPDLVFCAGPEPNTVKLSSDLVECRRISWHARFWPASTQGIATARGAWDHRRAWGRCGAQDRSKAWNRRSP